LFQEAQCLSDNLAGGVIRARGDLLADHLLKVGVRLMFMGMEGDLGSLVTHRNSTTGKDCQSLARIDFGGKWSEDSGLQKVRKQELEKGEEKNRQPPSLVLIPRLGCDEVDSKPAHAKPAYAAPRIVLLSIVCATCRSKRATAVR